MPSQEIGSLLKAIIVEVAGDIKGIVVPIQSLH